jgi:hypothetical protein
VEGLSFYEIRKDGDVPQKFVEKLVKQKCGKEPVAVIVFERQNAAAVVLPDSETAAQLRCGSWGMVLGMAVAAAVCREGRGRLTCREWWEQ